MNRRTFRILVPLVVALSLVTSACFQIRFINMDPNAVDNTTDKVAVRLKLYRLSEAELNTNGYPFLLIGWESGELALNGIRPFDLGSSNFGGPFDRVKDNTLKNLLFTPGNCTANGIDVTAITGIDTWEAYRTVNPMDSTAGSLTDPFRINMFFKAVFNGDGSLPADDDRGDIVIFSGHWGDVGAPGNGVPDAGETVCTGMVFTSIGTGT